ncbi:MAG: hypothetical protein DMG14_06375, partial [Acidobacteria bacterium]
MSLKQTIYFMALVGGFAGLLCWSVVVWISWMPDLISATVLGMLIGGLTVVFSDRWSGEQIVPRWVLSGIAIGFVAGILSGLVQLWIGSGVIEQKRLAVIMSWTVTGTLIGFGTGLRWAGINKLRVLHALGGGMFGGLLGGLVFASWTLMPASSQTPWMADLVRAMGLMMTGIGITCGVTLAPVLLRDGVLRFISSGDGRAQNKYGPNSMEWALHDGDSYLAGSLGADATVTLYGHEVQIYIPDAMVNARHAIIRGRKGHFFIEQHSENRGPQGQPLYPLQLRG